MKMQWRRATVSVFLIVISVGSMVLMWKLATTRALTSAETVLLQLLSIVPGVLASYCITQWYDLSRRPQAARSAFRRLTSLYNGLSRIGHIIEDDDGGKLGRIKEVTYVMLRAADDAIEDWRDLDPESVAELKSEVAAKRRHEHAG